ncbi:MAG: TolB family protein, partial [Egibacteraceae bacterium]
TTPSRVELVAPPSPSPQPSVAPSPSQTPTGAAPRPSSPLPPAEGLPKRWVAHLRDHRLALMDTATGEVVRVLAAFDDPATFEEESGEPQAGGHFLGEFDLAPDGRSVYYDPCCEPAYGVTFRLPLDGGEEQQVSSGSAAAVSPDGSRLALVEGPWLTVVDLRNGRTRRFERDGDDWPELAAPSWSPDSLTVALEVTDAGTGDRVVGLLDVTSAASLSDLRTLPVRGGATFPVFRRDGSLLVAAQRRDRNGEPEGRARGVVLDPTSGEVTAEFDYGGTVTSQDYDRSGTYLLYTLADGSVRWLGTGERGRLTARAYDAAW